MAKALGHRAQDVVPLAGLETGQGADQRCRNALVTRLVAREAALVAEPALIDIGVIAREDSLDLAFAQRRPGVAARRAAGADRRHVDDLPRARLKAVGRRQQCADWAELGDVAREGVAVRLLVERRDDALSATLARDEFAVLGDIAREAGAAITEDAALAVEHDRRRDRQRLLVRTLRQRHARIAGAVAERQVLQRALATLVADGAVERVIEQDELEDTVLSLLRLGRGLGGLDDHAVVARHRAGSLQLRCALDLDETHAAGTNRRSEPRLVTEDGDLDARVLGGGDDQRRALRHRDLTTVDVQGDGVDGLLSRAHQMLTSGSGARKSGG